MLDLLYTSDEDLFSDIEVQENNLLSDHRLIVANMAILSSEAPEHEEDLPQNILSLRSLNFFDKKVNWNRINQELASINWEEKFHGQVWTDISTMTPFGGQVGQFSRLNFLYP